ncbi:MAG: histidine kinase [Opitutaceae bacterium]|nr:histidine kinase [Opitutaceae bacterium]
MAWRLLLLVWAVAMGLLLFQVLTMLPPGLSGRQQVWVMGQQIMRAIYWALLTPLVLRLLWRWPMRGAWRFAHVLGHLVAAVFGMALFVGVRVPVFKLQLDLPDHQSIWLITIARMHPRNLIDIPIYAAIVFVGLVIRSHRRRQYLELAAAQSREQAALAELHALRQQVQPHFLYNSLNAVANLVRAGRQEQAVRTLGHLGAMQRRLVEDSGRAERTLAEEVAFLRDYLAVEQIRFGDRLRTELELPAPLQAAWVPALILQPLVENAVKHAVARCVNGGTIRLHVTAANGRLQLALTNDLPLAEPQPPTAGTGSGLRLTRERLSRHFGDAARLDVARTLRTFTVTLNLPLRLAAMSHAD